MKIDEVSLQAILRAYGKPSRPKGGKPVPEKSPEDTSTAAKKAVQPGEIEPINYDGKGRVSISTEKKQALVDFFQ